jgi:hypothetical protein
MKSLVIRFWQHDHFIFLDAIVYVEIGITLFQMTLQDTQAQLPQLVLFQVSPLESLVVQSYFQLQAFFE